MTVHVSDGYALLIGVNDYRDYDVSQSMPKGTSNLHGSLNDVASWWKQCMDLQIPPARIRVLTSPSIDLSQLPGGTPGHVGEATKAEILAGVEWLATKLAAPSRPIGLMTYSGHGDFVQQGPTDDQGLVLCPTDTTADAHREPLGTVSFHHIRASFDAHNSAGNLTVVLDCCHSGTGLLERRSALALTRRVLPEKMRQLAMGSAPSLPGRVLAACRADETSYQAKLGGRVHGAFTWALTIALEQWELVREGSVMRSTVGYGELRSRAESLFAALSFPQHPTLQPSSVVDLPVFHHGPADHPGEISNEPNADRGVSQLDPDDRAYVLEVFTISTSTLKVMVTKTASSPYLAGKEYWDTNNTMLTAIATATSGTAMTISGVSHNWPAPTGFSSDFVMPDAVSWGTASAPGSLSWVYTDSGSNTYICIVFNLTNTSGTYSVDSITWYLAATGTPHSGTYVFPDGTTYSLSYASAPTLPMGYSWFGVTVFPI